MPFKIAERVLDRAIGSPERAGGDASVRRGSALPPGIDGVHPPVGAIGPPEAGVHRSRAGAVLSEEARRSPCPRITHSRAKREPDDVRWGNPGGLMKQTARALVLITAFGLFSAGHVAAGGESHSEQIIARVLDTRRAILSLDDGRSAEDCVFLAFWDDDQRRRGSREVSG